MAIITTDFQELIQAAFQGFMRNGTLKALPETSKYQWNYTIRWKKPDKREGLLIDWEMVEKKPDPPKEEYKSGGWKDPELDKSSK